MLVGAMAQEDSQHHVGADATRAVMCPRVWCEL